MMDNTYYVEVLKNIRSFFISQTDDIFGMLLFVLILILLILIFSKKIKDKKYVIAFIIMTIILPVITFVVYRYNINSMNYDIKNETFDSYNGEVYIRFYKSRHGSYENTGKILGTDLTIVDLNNKYGTYPNYTSITYGRYSGTIIYGRNSKNVVYWNLVRLDC